MSDLPTLDLHAVKVEDVADRVDRFIVRHSAKPRVRIMTGKGTGRVQQAVIEYLRLGGFPWEHERLSRDLSRDLSRGGRNTGVLVVFLA